jgi:hypothetical protein
VDVQRGAGQERVGQGFVQSGLLYKNGFALHPRKSITPLPFVFQRKNSRGVGRITCMVARLSIEHKEQVKLVQRVRAFYPDVLIAAIPNGGSRSASERVRLHGEGVLAGMPDLCVLRRSKGFGGLFVEMKTKVGVVSKEQSCIAKQLNSEGYLCVIARSADEGFKIIEEYLDES